MPMSQSLWYLTQTNSFNPHNVLTGGHCRSCHPADKGTEALRAHQLTQALPLVAGGGWLEAWHLVLMAVCPDGGLSWVCPFFANIKNFDLIEEFLKMVFES